jgi:hypothetical protein
VLQRAHHVGDEILAVLVNHLRIWIALAQHVADRVDEMGLAQAGAAVDEQRVVGPAGIFGDLQAGGAGNLIRVAFDEGLKGEIRVENPAFEQFAAMDSGWAAAAPPPEALLRFPSPASSTSTPLPISSSTGVGCSGLHAFQHGLICARWCFLTQSSTKRFGASSRRASPVLPGMQRSDPGAQLLFGQFAFQTFQTSFPQRVVHNDPPYLGGEINQSSNGLSRSIYPQRCAHAGCVVLDKFASQSVILPFSLKTANLFHLAPYL